MPYIKPSFAILLIILLFPIIFFAQSTSKKNIDPTQFDSTGFTHNNSDLLINGPVYYQPNRLANGNPFLFSSAPKKGIIYTRGQSFKGVNINYDIADDNLLLLINQPNNIKLRIILSSILIDSFFVNNQLYISTAAENINSNYNYLMLINNNKYKMLVGYKKEMIKRFDKINPQGTYSSVKQTIFIASDDTLIQINSKKAFLKTIPDKRKEITSFLRKNKIHLLKATPYQLKLLMEYYNNQMEKADV